MARVVLASEYYERTCVPYRNKYRVTLVNFEEAAGGTFIGSYTINVMSGYTGQGDLTMHSYTSSDMFGIKAYERYNLGKTDDFIFDPSNIGSAYVKIRTTLSSWVSVIGSFGSASDTQERSISMSNVMNAVTPGDDPTGLYHIHIYPKFGSTMHDVKLNFRIEPIE